MAHRILILKQVRKIFPGGKLKAQHVTVTMPSKAWLQVTFTVGDTGEESTEPAMHMAEHCCPLSETERTGLLLSSFQLWLKPSLTPDLLQVPSVPYNPIPFSWQEDAPGIQVSLSRILILRLKRGYGGWAPGLRGL